MEFKLLCFNDSSLDKVFYYACVTCGFNDSSLYKVFYYAWLNENRSRHKQALLRLQLHFWTLFMNCGFNHKLFHWACIENFVFIHWRSLYKAGLWTVIFVPFGLETSDIRKPVKCLSPRREANKIMFLFLCFIVWPYNKHLINQARSICMGESWPRSLVQTSLRSVCTGDVGQDSPIQTSRAVNKS